MNPGEGGPAAAGRVRIEAAVESVAAAVAAERAGAARVELCADLDVGGLTPSGALVAETLRSVQVPVHVMIRPRAGNFVYDAEDVEVMCRAAAAARDQGVAGIVCGALTPEGEIDDAAVRRVLASAGSGAAVFHRAFDLLHDPLAALETLVALGFDAVLTSGGAATALEGLAVLNRLVAGARGRIAVMAGGGVTGSHVRQLVGGAGVAWVHARCEPDGRRIAGITAALGV